MKVIGDIWLCSDCVFPAVYDDYSSLYHHYEPEEAERRMKEVQRGLARLPGLVADTYDEPHLECSDCGSKFPTRQASTVEDEWGDSVLQCECGSTDVNPISDGVDEFSRYECDCCGSDLAGERMRFAQLLRDDSPQDAQTEHPSATT